MYLFRPILVKHVKGSGGSEPFFYAINLRMLFICCIFDLNKTTMNIDTLKDKLRNQEVGSVGSWVYPYNIPPTQVDKILATLGSSESIGQDWNGCDLDWSQKINFEGNEFIVWGSAYEGSLVFHKK